MTYDQALGIVKAAMKSGTLVLVRYLNPDDGFEIQLTDSLNERSTTDFALAVAWLPSGVKVWQ